MTMAPSAATTATSMAKATASLDKTPARSWRMTATDYRAAVARTPHGPEPSRLTEAPWDPQLTRAMAEHGTAVVEGDRGPVGGPDRCGWPSNLLRSVVTLI